MKRKLKEEENQKRAKKGDEDQKTSRSHRSGAILEPRLLRQEHEKGTGLLGTRGRNLGS